MAPMRRVRIRSERRQSRHTLAAMRGPVWGPPAPPPSKKRRHVKKWWVNEPAVTRLADLWPVPSR